MDTANNNVQQPQQLWTDERIAADVSSEKTYIVDAIGRGRDVLEPVPVIRLCQQMRDNYEAERQQLTARIVALEKELTAEVRNFEACAKQQNTLIDMHERDKQRIAELERELAELRCRRWEPVEDGEYEGQHKDHSVIIEGEWLTIQEPDWDCPGQFLDTSIALYDDLRLCRLAPHAQEEEDSGKP